MSNPFDGDGRVVVQPTTSLPGCRSIPVRRATMRGLAAMFDNRKQASHLGSTLWVTLLHCQLNKIPHRITVDYSCNAFYLVEVIKK